MKTKCSICGRIYEDKIPKGGDGSVVFPRKHYRNIGLSRMERELDGTYCLGCFKEGIEVKDK